MKLIAALGNPTPKYKNTRHNVGFMALDFYLQKRGLTLDDSKKFQSKMLKFDKIIFLQPQTFMNLSGISLQKILSFYKIQTILVLHDDLDLKLGSVRFKYGGSSGGHNGLKSIDNHIGSDYLRLRIGIGRPQMPKDATNTAQIEQNLSCEHYDQKYHNQKHHNKIVDFVLESFSAIELSHLQDSFVLIAQALDAFIAGASLNKLQNDYTKNIKE